MSEKLVIGAMSILLAAMLTLFIDFQVTFLVDEAREHTFFEECTKNNPQPVCFLELQKARSMTTQQLQVNPTPAAPVAPAAPAATGKQQ